MRSPQNLKKYLISFDETVVLLSRVKTSGRFFQMFVTFSEKLDFNVFAYIPRSVQGQSFFFQFGPDGKKYAS